MKRLALSFLVALVVTSCAGLPPAENKDDSLVIGSFIVDFPDGFFDQKPRTIDGCITLTFKNLTQGSSFTVLTTDGGYFWFLSNGSDSYELQKYRWEDADLPGRKFTLESNLGYTFPAVPEKVLYLGHFLLSYRLPEKPDPSAYGGGHVSEVQWNFTASMKREAKTDAMSEFLKRRAPESAWISHDIVAMPEKE